MNHKFLAIFIALVSAVCIFSPTAAYLIGKQTDYLSISCTDFDFFKFEMKKKRFNFTLKVVTLEISFKKCTRFNLDMSCYGSDIDCKAPCVDLGHIGGSCNAEYMLCDCNWIAFSD